MLVRFLKRSLLNRKTAVALMIITISSGTALVASLITVSLEIGSKVSRELRAFGANIRIEPRIEGLAGISGQRRYVREEDMLRAKTIFWRHNILGISPFLTSRARAAVKDKTGTLDVVGSWYEKELPLPGESGTFTAGIKTVSPWWNIEGRWPGSDREIIAGVSVARGYGIGTGDSIFLDGKEFLIAGTIETGGKEDHQVFMNMETLQGLHDMKGKVSYVLVSALAKPMDDFAYKDPETMSQAEYEKWYCTGYVTSIAKQLEEVFRGSRARPVWQVAETEGKVLNRLTLLVYLLSFTVIAASALGVSTVMIMSFMRRVHEIGLMKAMGADRAKVVTVFLSESVLTGLTGGVIGYLLSIAVSRFIGLHVFSSALAQRDMLLPVSIGSAVLIAVLGTIIPIRKALLIRPAVILKGAE